MDNDRTPNSQPEVSVVIPASDHAKQLQHMIRTASEATPNTEVIVVCAGLKPETTSVAIALGATVVTTGSSHLSYDESRAIGAHHATGKYIIFLDDCTKVDLLLYKQYLSALRTGWDVVITIYPSRSSRSVYFSRSMTYQLFNHLIGRTDLESGSLCKVPYAWTRKALEQVGYEALSVPPLALMKAVQGGASLKGIRSNGFIKRVVASGKGMIKSTQQIIHDHAEAINCWLQGKGERGGLIDGNRYRLLLQVSARLHLRTVHGYKTKRKKGGG